MRKSIKAHHDISGNSGELPFLLPLRLKIALKTAARSAILET